MTEEVVSLIKRRETLLNVYGEVKYFDVFERPHQSTFCQLAADTSSFEWCDAYNEGN